MYICNVCEYLLSRTLLILLYDYALEDMRLVCMSYAIKCEIL